MAKEFLPNSFNELYEKIDFVEFALHLGFQIDKSKSSKSIVLKRGEDNINVYYVKPSGDPWGPSARYYNLDGARKNMDQGFLKELVINYCYLEDPTNKIWSASKILHDYLNIPYGKRQEKFKTNLENYTVNRNSNKLMQPMGADDPNIVPLKDHRFLEGWRKLDPSTINRFKEAIYSFKIETSKNQKFYNTAFPLYCGKDIQGFECRNQTQNQNYKSIQGNAYGVWLSTTNFSEVEKICLAESAIDCMAHYELNSKMNQNTLYISYSGNLYDAKLDNLNDIIYNVLHESKHLSIDSNLGPTMQFKKANIISIGDNDRKGAENHLRLITKLVDKNLEDKITIKGMSSGLKSEAGKFYQVDIPKTILSQEQSQTLLNFIDGYNQKLQKTYTGEKKNLFFQYIKVKALKNTPDRYTFIVPNNTEGLKAFGKIFAYATNKELYRIQVPKTKDFNDDLKEVKKKALEPKVKKKGPKF